MQGFHSNSGGLPIIFEKSGTICGWKINQSRRNRVNRPQVNIIIACRVWISIINEWLSAKSFCKDATAFKWMKISNPEKWIRVSIEEKKKEKRKTFLYGIPLYPMWALVNRLSAYTKNTMSSYLIEPWVFFIEGRLRHIIDLLGWMINHLYWWKKSRVRLVHLTSD